MTRAHFLRSLGLFAALGLGLQAAGCAGTESYVVEQEPPPDQYEEVQTVAPYPGGVWVRGHWRWRGGRYQWMPGHWVRGRGNRVYVPARYERHGNRWRYEGGHFR